MEDKLDINRIRKDNSALSKGQGGKFRPKYSFEFTLDGVGSINRTNDVSQLNIGKIGSILNESTNIDADFEDVDYISDADCDNKKMD